MRVSRHVKNPTAPATKADRRVREAAGPASRDLPGTSNPARSIRSARWHGSWLQSPPRQQESLMASKPDKKTTEKRTSATTRDLPLVALRETVIFPEMIVPLQVGREKSVAALNAAVANGGPIALVTQRQADQEDITNPSELYSVGTVAKIAQVVQLQDGTVRAIIQGQARMRLHGFVKTDPFIRARIEELEDQPSTDVEVQALMRSVQAQVEQYVQAGAPVPPEAA